LELEEKSEALEFQEESEALEFEEEESSPAGPSAFEIHNLLMQVCDETSNIAEVELKVGTFSMKVRREIGKAAPAPKPVAQGPPVLGQAMVEYKSTNAAPSAPSKSTMLAKTAPSSAAASKAAVDGGLLFVTSPKVGVFRQGRTVKGKSGPPLCVEGQVVKKGQVVCYLEQLGTQQPVEADIAGEVEQVLCNDGEPVGYGDRLIAIRP
jgi:biotin carboxyl carrier protein